MIWKRFVSLPSFEPRRRIVATTIVYGLSLAVRFTSATGDEVEIPPQSLQYPNPGMSVVTRDSAQLPYAEWIPSAPRPILLRSEYPRRTPPVAGCLSP